MSGPWVPLLVALGAGAGAALRYRVASALDGTRTDGAARHGPTGWWPSGTFSVNVVGSGLAGAFAALALGDRAWALLAVGLCGGLTTWSGLAVQAQDLGWRRGTAYAVATVLAGVAACAAAFVLASAQA